MYNLNGMDMILNF